MAGASLTPLPCGTGLGCPKAMGARPRTQKHAEDGGTEPKGAISLDRSSTLPKNHSTTQLLPTCRTV